MRKIKFSVSDVEYAAIAFEARAKGYTVSQYIKGAVFSHIAKYPAKGIMAEIAREYGPDKKTATG